MRRKRAKTEPFKPFLLDLLLYGICSGTFCSVCSFLAGMHDYTNEYDTVLYHSSKHQDMRSPSLQMNYSILIHSFIMLSTVMDTTTISASSASNFKADKKVGEASKNHNSVSGPRPFNAIKNEIKSDLKAIKKVLDSTTYETTEAAKLVL
jgi:hypothetical protein